MGLCLWENASKGEHDCEGDQQKGHQHKTILFLVLYDKTGSAHVPQNWVPKQAPNLTI